MIILVEAEVEIEVRRGFKVQGDGANSAGDGGGVALDDARGYDDDDDDDDDDEHAAKRWLQ